MLQLITVLNRCHRFPGFVYQQARFSSDHKSIEIAVRSRKGSKPVCSRCHQPGPGYDQLAERRFEFIPFWGFLVFLIYAMRRVDCRLFSVNYFSLSTTIRIPVGWLFRRRACAEL
jgi:hypothetical protein